MKLITIDRGNTNATLGLHLNGELQSVSPFSSELIEPNVTTMQSIVGKNDLKIPNLYPLAKFRSPTHFLDMPIQYSLTLGEDRISTAYYAFKKDFKKTIIIDAGSFITIDLVSGSGLTRGFRGGFIFPGITKLLKIYQEGAQLPNLVNQSLLMNKLEWPQNTETAILAATSKMLHESIYQIIENEKPERILLTGGDAQKILPIISSSTPVDLTPHLVHLGLSQIHQSLVSLKLI